MKSGRMLQLVLHGFCVLALLPLLSVARDSNDRSGELQEVTAFGSNPGNLRMFVREPVQARSFEGLRPLIVLLHGCAQDAEGLMRLTRWGAIADSAGCYLLLPQQSRANNGMRCFNWFKSSDAVRDQGEAASIAQMITHAQGLFPIDASRTHAYGVSAGGAMAVVLAACYPELLLRVAVVAGAPYGGFVRDEHGRLPGFRPSVISPSEWADRIRRARVDEMPSVPRVIVMHGTSDGVADFSLALALVAQWTALCGTDSVPDTERRGYDPKGRVARFGYSDAKGGESVVLYRIERMGHRLPVAAGVREPFGKDIGFHSTRAIAREFGLID